jgi:energy-coupling factor transporter ATP-binding protein EcfA2
MHTTITVTSSIQPTPRVAQVAGLFDLPAEAGRALRWDVNLPLDERPWSIGLITGPSGCGKSTIARNLWPDQCGRTWEWSREHSVLDAFPETLPVKEITALLSSVGFSSPPAWLRPFHVLSTGQQFRVHLARLLADAVAHPDGGRPIVCDEYTSVVDRTVARIGSAAVARAVRARNLTFIAATCHDDVEEWLQPDWVYRPAEDRFTWRCLRRRPAIRLHVFRCQASAWPLFAPNHYLNTGLVRSAVCFLATWEERPVAFSAWLPLVGPGPPARREHRTVTLPDFQGVGIGNALSATVAAMWRGLGFRAVSTTTHPAMTHARRRSPLWRIHRPPSLATSRERHLTNLRHATRRLTAGFDYVGPALPQRLALALLAA